MNKNIFSKLEPMAKQIGDLWFNGTNLFVAKRKGSQLVWKKRA